MLPVPFDITSLLFNVFSRKLSDNAVASDPANAACNGTLCISGIN